MNLVDTILGPWIAINQSPQFQQRNGFIIKSKYLLTVIPQTIKA